MKVRVMTLAEMKVYHPEVDTSTLGSTTSDWDHLQVDMAGQTFEVGDVPDEWYRVAERDLYFLRSHCVHFDSNGHEIFPNPPKFSLVMATDENGARSDEWDGPFIYIGQYEYFNGIKWHRVINEYFHGSPKFDGYFKVRPFDPTRDIDGKFAEMVEECK